jgi:hypothetical protein
MKYLFLSLILLTSSCGNKDDKDDPVNISAPIVTGELVGNYKAIMRPINTSVNGWLPTGAAEIYVNDQQINIKTYLDDDTKVTHIQSIHQGIRCPTINDDSNGDGFIDALEAEQVVGNVMIPLDGDISSPEAGQGVYPKGKSFTYFESAPLVKLIQNHSLNNLLDNSFHVEGRVVQMHGTSDINRVPPTVAEVNGQPRNLSIPIACGIIKRR